MEQSELRLNLGLKSSYRTGSGGTIHLGNKLGQGGEGVVYRVLENAEWVAKIYHDNEVKYAKGKKAAFFTTLTNDRLLEATSWPFDTLLDDHGRPIGFLMPLLHGTKSLFEAYHPKSRSREFPRADYRFLVRVAKNFATAVYYVHEAGCIIGDLNESNTLVDDRAMVKLIDADSFQVVAEGDLYPCPVAKTELLAPELHGEDLDLVERTITHDCFPLAVLLFHILVLGRHPYAGIPKDDQEFTLETAIVNHWYAYSTRTDIPQKPPRGMDLSYLSPKILTLFERAFDGDLADRPSSQEWHEALTRYENELMVCSQSPQHWYWRGGVGCPWCAMETAWRVRLFGGEVAAAVKIAPEPELASFAEYERLIKRMENTTAPIFYVPEKLPTKEDFQRAGRIKSDGQGTSRGANWVISVFMVIWSSFFAYGFVNQGSGPNAAGFMPIVAIAVWVAVLIQQGLFGGKPPAERYKDTRRSLEDLLDQRRAFIEAQDFEATKKRLIAEAKLTLNSLQTPLPPEHQFLIDAIPNEAQTLLQRYSINASPLSEGPRGRLRGLGIQDAWDLLQHGTKRPEGFTDRDWKTAQGWLMELVKTIIGSQYQSHFDDYVQSTGKQIQMRAHEKIVEADRLLSDLAIHLRDYDAKAEAKDVILRKQLWDDYVRAVGWGMSPDIDKQS
jgi:hypothetical protein